MLKCPNHELPGNIIIDNFYARLSFQDKTLLDTTCSGSFTSNKEEFKRDLLDRIKENAEDWENDKGKESGYADKPPFKPLPPKEGNEEKEEKKKKKKKKKKKGTKKKKKKENKKKEVTAYPRVNEITLGNRKYVAPNDYYDNESEYDDLPIPFTHISDHDLDEHAAFDIENLFGTDYEINDDSIIHVPLNDDIESSKLGDVVLEDPVFETSTFSENDDITYSDKTLLDTTCSGSFTSNKEEFKRDLLDRIKENAEDWENDKGKESGYADKPPFKPLPPKEENEEKEEKKKKKKKKKKKGTKKKKKKENKKKEVTAYPRVNEITLGNRKYVAPNDYYDNESEYDDLPIPFTHISDHDLDEHAAFDIENLFGTDYEINDDSIIHVPLNDDIESSKLGDVVLEDPVFETSTFSENDDITYSGFSKMSTAAAPRVSLAKSGASCQTTAPAIRTPSFVGYAKQTSSLSGLRMSSKFRASATYKIKLMMPEGEEHEFEAPDDMHILEAAEEAGVELPFSCRAGSCSTCAGKMDQGEVDQSEGSFLDENQMGEGYLLTCISYPKADCVIRTHQEEELY
ncbi:hypothetical protein QYE76_037677 [Lolium multiflorum]|uniref:2Fe-2S ferredoxin-type domain-containing protein n=1 Tax=Lolium multiflorum TaxID=4521 RepID=A0AAD8QHW6_LOLMU|nr:hypothetical protein QYE76_037677 [Lolium multiflorum]